MELTKEQYKIKKNSDANIKHIISSYNSIDNNLMRSFSDFPLSSKTLNGLNSANFIIPTDIQRECIGLALKGHDIVASAITGGGKTLAFLIPILENLYVNKWSRMDGVGAIIISPTRELSYQIFESLKQIGSFHDFSAGLIIGGKNLKFEQRRMDQCNIIICTPGRLLQHMDENPLFSASSLQILVLDEADRCLDMGFKETMNSIIENLPEHRQTLLFSATQKESVKHLARLGLKNACYVTPVFQQQIVTPEFLKQSYVVVKLEQKITMLWSFLKNHLKRKCLVFLASCNQVKYIHEIFCKLRLSSSLLALHGKLHQDRRIAIYNEFVRKRNVVLFATDVASRGLDFPVVNWVIQLDCPENVTQYIHRAGRSARNKTMGESLLVLMPSEEEHMIVKLKSKHIDINKLHIDPQKLSFPRAKLEGYLAQNRELKESAQRAFISYIKSVFIMKNKKIFKVDSLNIDEYGKSLGLAVIPRVRFLERQQKVKGTGLERICPSNNFDFEMRLCDSNSFFNYSCPDGEDIFTIKNAYKKFNASTDDKLFITKNEDCKNKDDINIHTENLPIVKKVAVVTKAALAKRVLKKKIRTNKNIKFNADGIQLLDSRNQIQSVKANQYVNASSGGIDIEDAKKVLLEEDIFDKQRFKNIIKAKHKKQKVRMQDKSNELQNDINDGFTDEPLYFSSFIHNSIKEKGNESLEPIKKKSKGIAFKLSLNEAEILATELLSK